MDFEDKLIKVMLSTITVAILFATVILIYSAYMIIMG
jgi:hypothetical protein